MSTKSDKEAKENHLDDSEKRWFAVYTHSRAEKMAFKRLLAKDINAYLPIQKKIRVYGRKKRTVELPLITCYIFVKVSRKDYVKVLETEGIINYVKIRQNLISIPEREIDLMRKLLGEGWEVEVADSDDFSTGDLVEINQGQLVGTRGRLVEKSGKNLFKVELETLGYSLQVDIDMGLLNKV